MNRRELANGGASAAVALAIGPQARSFAADSDRRATAIKTWAPYVEAIAIESDLARDVTHESLRALAERGGDAGIIFWPYLRIAKVPGGNFARVMGEVWG